MARKRRPQRKSIASASGILSSSKHSKDLKKCFVKLKRLNISTLNVPVKIAERKVRRKVEENQMSSNIDDGSNKFQLQKTELQDSRITRRKTLVGKINDNKNRANDGSEKQKNMSIFKQPKEERAKIVETPKKTTETTLDDVYELQLSQPSASETEDMILFEKLAKEGKVQIKHKRKAKNVGKIKKKYVNPSKTWYNIEKSLGINSVKQKMMKSKVKNVTSSEVKANKENVRTLNPVKKSSQNDNNIRDDVIVVHREQNVSSTPNKSLNMATEDIIEPSIEKEQTIIKRRTPVIDKKKLLEFARNHVSQSKSSTPIASKQKRTGNPVVFSPILPSSPWKQNKNRISTFSLDDSISDFGNSSNVENISPNSIKQQRNQITASTAVTPVRDDKFKTPRSGVLSVRQSSVVKRSPLKEINVLEVINLPPLPLRPRRVNELSSPFKDKKKKSDATGSTAADLFGFNEIEDIETDEHNTTVIPGKANLKRKLRNLKKLLPSVENRSNHNTRQQHKKIPPLFGESTSKQANIREMLSSTTVNNSNISTAEKSIDDEILIDNDNMNLNESTIVKETNNDSVITVDLFNDPIDPETTLDTTKIKKTYSRHREKPKRFFIFFSDEESDNETEETSNKKKRQRKKQNKEQSNEKELNEFAKEFNSICEEAENYELVTEVENSTLDV